MGRPRGSATNDVESVLAAAVAEFVEQGYDATGMEDIARSLGVTKAALYHHVGGGKEALLSLALDRAFTALQTATDVPRGPDEAADRHLERVVASVVAETVGPALPYVTLLLRARGGTDAGRTALRRRRQFDREMAALVQAGIDEGALRDDLDARTVARLFYGMVNSLTEWYRPGRAPGPDALAANVVALLLEGLRVEPHP